MYLNFCAIVWILQEWQVFIVILGWQNIFLDFKLCKIAYLYLYKYVCVCVFAFVSAIWNPIEIPFGTNVPFDLEMVLKQ